MHGSLAHCPRRPVLGEFHIPLVALLFWLFTYALLSFRAEMALGDGFALLSGRRMLATSVGAALFGLVLGRIIMRPNASARRSAAIIATIFPASLAVLASRLLLDRLYYEQPLAVEDNIRWVLVWAGYFGLWVSASLALNLHAQSHVTHARVQAVNRPTSAAPRETEIGHRAECPPAEAWNWVVDALAVELAAVPPPERAALVHSLASQAGYELADELDPKSRAQNARVKLVQRLIKRLGQQSRWH